MTDDQKQVVAPSGGQTDASAAGGSSQPRPASDELTGDEARSAYPKQVEAALEYASSNRYDYGPRFRNLELEHTVISARPMSDRITRITLEYRPVTKFTGQSGSEYFDVDAQGVIQVRRQIRVPKETMPWVLIGIASLSVIAAAVLIPIMLFVEKTPDTTFVSGRTLFIKSEQPKHQPYVTYEAQDLEGTDRTWIIVPEGEGTEIAWVELTVINQTSGVVSLAINTDAATMTTESGLTVSPIDVYSRVQWPAEGAEVSPRMNALLLPLWGSRTLEAQQQITGFMAFEVPRGSSIRSLRWSATDVANIRY